MVETINKLVRVSRQLLQELGREPTPEEIAERMEIPVERVREILKISQEPVSLETPIGEEEDSHLGDFIPDEDIPSPVDAAAYSMLQKQLREVLDTLSEREKKVLILRFGLDDGRPRTLEEVGREFKGTTNVKHFAQILRDDVGFEKLASLIEKPLDLNVAVHYGCHFLKPTETIGIEDNAEDPSILDDLVEITGAKSVDYKDKMMCCGAGGGLRSRDLDVTTSFTKEKLDHMTAAGVDAIVNVCPFCHLQFDQGQVEVNEKYGTDFALPVFHLAQLYGLAMGLSPEELTFDAQRIDATPALAKALGENAK
jgi:hypothetical protein